MSKYELEAWTATNTRFWRAKGMSAASVMAVGWVCYTPDGCLIPGACGPETGDEGQAKADAALEAWIAKQSLEPDLQECRRLLAAYAHHSPTPPGVAWDDVLDALGLAHSAGGLDVVAIARGER